MAARSVAMPAPSVAPPRRFLTILLAAVLAIAATITAGASPVAATTTVTETFGYTGTTQTFTVPSGVTSITVTLQGGQGGRGGVDFPTPNFGGYQGVVTGTIEVTPGQIITVAVGGGGGQGSGGGSAPGGAGGQNPLAGYDGAVGGISGWAGSSGAGGGSGAATVLQIDGVDVVAGGAGGNGGNGQFSVLIGRVSEDRHVPRPDATSTTGRPGYNTSDACGGSCDGGASGAGGGGAQGGDRGDVQYGGATATEWFGFGGAPGLNSTAGLPGLIDSYAYYSGNSANGSVTIIYDNGAPGTPTNLSATAQTDAVALAWNAPGSSGASDIEDYLIEYATNSGGPWTPFVDGVSTETSAQVTGLTNGTNYFFRVAAENDQGVGAFATTALATVPSDVPGTPTVTGTETAGGTIHVDFTPAPSDAPISGYEYRLDNGEWVAGSVTDTRLTITGLTNGQTYAVEIRALNVIGVGPASAPAVSATPSDVPDAPTGLRGVGADGSIEVDWLAPTVDNGSPVTGYVVETAPQPAGEFTSAYTGDENTTSTPISGLDNGTTYAVRVAAVNAAGQSAWSPTVEVTPYTVPGTPSLSLAPADGALDVDVTGFDGGSDLTLVEYQVDADAWRSTGSGNSSFTIDGLTNGTSYDVVVRVTNAAGVSSPSDPEAGTPRTVPSAPAISALALDAGSADVEFDVGSDGGSPLTNVEYSIDGGENWTTRAPASVVSPLEISGLSGGQSYDIVVRALNAAGASANSNTSTVIANGVPAVPSMTLVPGDRSILVEYDTPTNGGSPITSYEYALDGGSWTSVVSVESPFRIPGLTNGTEYSVGLRAVNGAGASVAAVDTATPRTTPTEPEIVGTPLPVTDGELSVDFTAPSSDGGSAILDYEYSTDNGATWRTRDVTSTSSPLVITGLSSDGTPLTGGLTYPVQIRAVNAAGAGAASAVVDGFPTSSPDTPVIDLIERRDGGVTVHFTQGSNGGSPIMQYEYRLGAGGTWTNIGTLDTVFDIDGLANGDYELYMRSENGMWGASDPTAAAPFSLFTLPGAPDITSIVAGDATLAVAFDAPASDGGNAITSYEYSTDGGVTWSAAAATTSPIDVTVVSGVAATPIVNGTLYAVQLRAVNAAGAGPASASEVVAPRGAPDAPSGLTISPADEALTLTFSLGADGGSPITAIEYQLDGGAWVPAGSLSSPLTITGLDNGTSYDVRVRVVNAIGDGDPTDPVSATPSALPGAPGSVVATGGPGTATATWAAPLDDGGAAVESYTISVYAQAAGGSPIASCSTTDLTGCDVVGLTNGVTVYVDVSAENATGSGPASAPRQAVTPLAVPEVSIGSVKPTQTALTITADVDDLGGAAISDYEYQLDGGDWVSTGSGANPFTISGLEFATAYEIRIRATSAAGVGPASDPVTATPSSAPGAPVAFAAASGPQSAVLTWSAPVSDGGQPITDYVVQYATSPSGPFLTFADGTSTSTTATVTGLVDTTAYVFRVAAVNPAGIGSWSSLSGATPLSAPSAPTITGITPGGSFLSVAFTAPASNGGSSVTGYQYRLDGGTWTTASSSSSPISITGLTNGQAYDVELRAVNIVGGGAASNTVEATPFGLPGAVTGFRASPTANSVTLDWDEGNSNGSPITSYNLIRWSGAIAGSIVQSYSVAGTSHTVTGLTAGTYYFTIEATNAAGTGPRSTPRTTGIVGGLVPSHPTIDAVVRTGAEIEIDWTAGAANTSPIDSYLVQYTADGSTWTTASSGSASTTATFTVPSSSARYAVRVAAVSATGVGGFEIVTPPVAVTEAVAAIDATSATFHGDADANGLGSDVYFEYAPTEALLGTVDAELLAATPAAVTGIGLTAVTADVTGLDPGTEYFVRVLADDNLGSVAYGATRDFSTEALISTTELSYEYTGSPVEVISETTPIGLALERTFVGIDGTEYPESTTAPTDVGDYQVTTNAVGAEIGGSEVVEIAITPKMVTNTIDALDRDYDGTDVVELTFTADGFVDGDDVAANTAATIGTIDGPDAGVDRPVSLESVPGEDVLTGADAANYATMAIFGDMLVTISPATQTLTFTSTPPSSPTVGDTYTPVAVSSQGLTPTYRLGLGAGTVCTLAAGTVSLVGAGTCVVQADQAGNTNVLAADTLDQSFTVAPAPDPDPDPDPDPEPDPDPDPELNVSIGIDVGGPVANAPVQVSGDGLKPFSTVTVELRSDPIVLGTFRVDANGSFSATVNLPAKVPAGSHQIVVLGVDPDGDPISESAGLFVDWSGSAGWTTPSGDDSDDVSQATNHVTSIDPVRVLDTRTGAGTKVQAGESYRLTIDETLLAADATAVVFNLAVTKPHASGYISVYPCASERQEAAVLNYRAGETVANLVIAPYGVGEELCIYSRSTTHVVVDLGGYYAEASGDPLNAVAPVRLTDTRSTTRLAAGETLVVDIVGDGLAPSDATAAALYVAAVRPAATGFLTVYACGESLPLASNLNYAAGQTIGNSALTKISEDGTVCIHTSVDTDVVVDLNGVASAGTESNFQSLVAGRLLDTRSSGQALEAGEKIELDFSSVEAGGAVTLNVAAVAPAATGFVTLYPCGLPQPVAASVNYGTGITRSNLVTVKLGEGGKVCAFTSQEAHLVVDVQGVYLSS